ncbi:unnamed protein product [Urochloa humidicola]
MSGVRQQPVAGGRGGWRVGPAALLARGSDHTKLLLELQSRRTSTIATTCTGSSLLLHEATCSLTEIAFT